MKIFIIDDDHLCTSLTHTMLGMEDGTHDVRTFHSATDALDTLISGGNEFVPDIIFLDLNMPVMDGWEFLGVLEQLDPMLNTRCRIYILTSSIDPADAKRAKEYRIVSGLIHKPIKSEDIQSVLFQSYNYDLSSAKLQVAMLLSTHTSGKQEYTKP